MSVSYRIITNENASDEEISILQEVSHSVGFENIKIEKTGDTTALGADGAPEVILVLQYIAKSVAIGIFAAIGIDVWNKIKEFTRIIFKMYRQRINYLDQWFYNPIIVIDLISGNKSKLQIQFPRQSLEELENSLDSILDELKKLEDEEFTAFIFKNDKWIKISDKFKSQKQIRDEIFQGYKTSK